MVDIWMVFCLFYPFTVVILYATLEAIRKVKQKSHYWKQIELLVSKILDWGLTLVSCGFILIYWIVGLWHLE